MSLDLPIMNWPLIEREDQFARQLGIYAKGKFGLFDYRIAVTRPFTAFDVSLTGNTAAPGPTDRARGGTGHTPARHDMCLSAEALALMLNLIGQSMITSSPERITVQATAGDVHGIAPDARRAGFERERRSSQPRVECVTQPVAQQIDRQGQRQKGGRREQQDPPFTGEQEALTDTDQGSEGGLCRWRADAQK